MKDYEVLMSVSGRNPHYTAYAAAHGKTFDEMLKADKIAWPGGCMCGFILWIKTMKGKFFLEHPEAMCSRDVIRDHEAWGKFLQHSTKG